MSKGNSARSSRIPAFLMSTSSRSGRFMTLTILSSASWSTRSCLEICVSCTLLSDVIVGVDGVGRLDDGSRVYFALPHAPYGSMAQRTTVSASQCLPLPDNLDDITAAAIANPGMSSWAAYTERAKLKRGETVLVNGATAAAGRLAVQIAKHLGAKKVIATGRNVEALHGVATLGADVTVPLVEDDDAVEQSFKEQLAAGV